MDEQTLKDIERAVDSPHRTAPARAGQGKTLKALEQTFHSPHLNAPDPALQFTPPPLPPAPSKKPQNDLPLDYEAIDSEPPDKKATVPEPAEEPKAAADLGAPDVTEVPALTVPGTTPVSDAPSPSPPSTDDAVPSDSPSTDEPAQGAGSSASDFTDTDAARDKVRAALDAHSDTEPNLVQR
jgi:hypothetical protein